MENIIQHFQQTTSTCWACKYTNSIWFCFLNQCHYFCGGDENSQEYKVLLDQYYAVQFENDTDYYRSDIDVTEQVDRVALKISQIEGTSNCYDGESMMAQILRMYDEKTLDSEATEDIRKEIRVNFRYMITKREFRGLCREGREQTEWRRINASLEQETHDNSSLGSLDSVYN